MSKQNIFRASIRSGLLIAVASILISCGGGGGGSGSTTDSQGDVFSVSPKSADQGSFITLHDPTIKSGESLTVTFNNSSWFETTAQAVVIDDGLAKVVVPPYFDAMTQTFGSGEMTVAIAPDKTASIQISALPELAGIEAGVVLRAYLEVQVENFNLLLNNLDSFEQSYQYDVTGMRQLLQNQLAEVNMSLQQLTDRGSIETYSVLADPPDMTKEELKVLDQLLYAWLKGMADEVDLLAGQGSETPKNSYKVPKSYGELDSVIASHRIPEIFSPAAWGGSIEKNSRQFVANLTWLTAMIKTNAGFIGDIQFNPAINAVKRIIPNLLIGVFKQLGEVLIYMKDGKSLKIVDELRTILPDLFDIMAPDKVKKVAGDIQEIIGLSDWVYQKFCGFGVIDKSSNFGVFCAELKARRNSKDTSRVDFVRLDPRTVEAMEIVKMTFNLSGNRPGTDHAQFNFIYIDWGDGSNEALNWGEFGRAEDHPTFGLGELTHQYVLDDGKPRNFTIFVSVNGNNDDAISTASARIAIMPIPELEVAINGPQELSLNEKGRWHFATSGGRTGFRGKIDWGDGATTTGESATGRFSASHRYQSENFYKLSVTMLDTSKQTATAYYSVKVGNIEWQKEEICGDGIDNTGEGDIDENCKPQYPNWEGTCDLDNSKNTGATAIWEFGDSSPYWGRGKVCSDRDGYLWMSHTSVGYGRWYLVVDVSKGGGRSSGCYDAPQVKLDAGAVIGGGWICPI